MDNVQIEANKKQQKTKLVPGVNDLETWCKENEKVELLEQWDYEKNGDLLPKDVARACNYNAYWKCKEGHEFQTTVGHRTSRGRGCPYCSGRCALAGENDLATMFPQLVEEWDFEQNGDVVPSCIKPGSKYNAYWRCEKNHSYQETVYNRTKKMVRCPYCFGRKVLVGFNDITTLCPQVANEWDYEKNTLTPNEVSRGSDTKVWWICSQGHSYESTVSHRMHGRGCPYCANKKLLTGYNDMMTAYPELMNEWDFEKNKEKPQEIIRGSHKKAWWKCPNGHSYQTRISHRTCTKTGCPVCASMRESSVPEKLTFFYLNRTLGDIYSVIPNDRQALGNGTELDIYIPELKVAIEYDGRWFHDENNAIKEMLKNDICKQREIALIRIRENGLSPIENCHCIMRGKNYSMADMDKCISDVLSYIISNTGVKVPFDISQTGKDCDFINCRRDIGEAVRLRDAVS